MSKLAGYFAKKNNIEVHLILFGKSRKIFFPLPESVNIYKPSWIFTDHTRIVGTFKTLFFLRRIVKRISPNTILSFGEYWNSFILLSLMGLDFPIYVSDRCQPTKSLGKLHDCLRNWLYPSASGIIAQTKIAKKIYQQKGLNENIRVIGNPIHQISLNGQPQEKENVILTVGRLIKSKHHDRLIKIFNYVSLSKWKLVIVGGDALKQSGLERLRGLVKKLGIEDKIEFTGTVSDIESYYKKSKIFAFTSSSEGFPNVIGEAMSAGIPVIAYDCVAGPSDLVDNGNTGFLAPPFEDLIYAEKLKLLVDNVDLRLKMGREGRKKIQEFRVDDIAEEFYSFILNSE